MRAILLYAGGMADSIIEGKSAAPAMPVGEDDFVELDEEGNPKRRSAAKKREPARAPVRAKKPLPAARRKMVAPAVPGVDVVIDEVEEGEVVVVDGTAENRPASAPRRRPVGRSKPTRG
jgi:small subunit ribosomal protein S2